jgi:tetratricopeptide (TPR) repeat protein
LPESPLAAGAALFGLALVVRLLHLALLRLDHPEILAHPVVDAGYYHRWAQDILAGKGLALRPFFMHPAYPYLIAALYALFGPHPIAVAVVQAGLGAAGVVLFFWLCRHWFDARTAAFSALVLALYRPLVVNDALLETVELGLFFLLVALLLTATARDSGLPGGRRAAAGVAFLLAVLCRGNLLLCAPVLLLAPMLETPGRLRQRLRAALPMAAGMLAVLLAVGARNRLQAGEWVMTMSSGGANLYLSHHRGAEVDARNPPPFLRNDPRFLEADFRREAERLSGRALTAGEVSRFWAGRALDEVAAEPGRAALRFVRRLGVSFGSYEIASNYELGYLGALTPLGRVPLPGFVWLVGLGLVGAGLCWGRRRALFLIYGVGGIYLLTLGLFFQTSRLRIYLVPFLIPLAVHAVGWCWAAWQAGRRGLVGAVAAGAAALTVASLALTPALVREVDRSQALSSHAVALMSVNRLREARALQEQALKLQPGNPLLLVNAGDAALRAGDANGAFLACGRAIAARPTLASAHNCSGIALARKGAVAQAEVSFRQAAALDRDTPDARFNLALVLSQTGRKDEALKLLTDLAVAFPGHEKTRRMLEQLRKPAP